MDNEFQKRWERIQQAIATELNGDVKPRVSSGRTLFGIKSEGESKMDEFAKQIEEEYAAKRRAERDEVEKGKGESCTVRFATSRGSRKSSTR